MSTPWTFRDLVSCFLGCRFPLDDEQPQVPIKNMGIEIKNDMRSNKDNKKLSRQNRCRKERHDDRDNAAVENKSNDTSWPHFQEEDYIVFCFREDGAFDVVKDCKSDALDRVDSANKSPRLVSRMLKYGEVAETVRNSSHWKRSNDSCLRSGIDEEGEEKHCSNLDTKSRCVTRSRQFGEIENGGIALSVESSDSNNSDSSKGSFSFPVLHWELMGSPVQMPRSESLYIRKHKASCARFQCCRF
ncbi:protein BREAKING OF ASYMMETRY IN THE STOMATAL LINEAGE isoform X2 [Ricinus communis]|uniref:Protein BREAKING OF ASYMMETRY IN THE STOMATAL LINEAGE n=1 Tax=Ricinus communis TaxID=3988 RepID=B9RLI7_RICCO|nr:protein BREAKING OF ASYMMETRY IN THE STOMATAL LINEAGE isoform X2 [Ricinus communis]EEF47712.1 conserved hypothetical protein [Ricinus communis]|eukprot:XP_002514606.1 protein BREAKING OF ASYMMETRY IN THE STOMATAL LINEAGE [Ricinus communis]